MNTQAAIEAIETAVVTPTQGLPKDIFFFVSRLTPMVNVDLLVNDEAGRVLLSWRDDIAGRGWHLPGGVVRFKERLSDRLAKVAETELGVSLTFTPEPMAINEVILPHDTRGHFISLLYGCSLLATFDPRRRGTSPREPGFLEWHTTCPEDLIQVHDMYRHFLPS